MLSFEDSSELAGGALLVAELSLGLLRRETGETLEECVRDLCVVMESSVG